MKKIANSLYSIRLPDNWQSESSQKDVISVFNPEGVGAVTISGYELKSEASQDSIKALENFVNGRGDVKKSGIANENSAEAEYEDEGRLVSAWAVCTNKGLILVSYNREKAKNSEVELKTVKEILNSMELLG